MELTTDKSFVTTTDEIAGYKIVKHFGMVIYSKYAGMMSPVVDSEVIDAMNQKLLASARELGANAVVGARLFVTPPSSLGDISGLALYGTAVKVEVVS